MRPKRAHLVRYKEIQTREKPMRSIAALAVIFTIAAYSSWNKEQRLPEYIHIDGKGAQHSQQPIITEDIPVDTAHWDTSRGPAIQKVDLGTRVTP